jgi:NUMOD3 motif
MDYYVYQYLRTDNTPYYIGKGRKNRAFTKQGHTVPLPSKDRIKFVSENLSADDAKNLEIELIAKYGRKDIGTGILRNMTDGGDGSPGRIATPEQIRKLKEARAKQITTEETREKMRQAHTGRVHSEETKKKMSLSSSGRKNSPETIQKIKEARKKQVIVTVQVTCPHCGKQGGNRIMPRYHFDNCKSLSVETY